MINAKYNNGVLSSATYVKYKDRIDINSNILSRKRPQLIFYFKSKAVSSQSKCKLIEHIYKWHNYFSNSSLMANKYGSNVF